MSHRFNAMHGTTFFYNGGFDGDVEIDVNGEVLKVPMEDLLHFVGCGYVRNEIISWAENARYDELLLRYFGEGV